MSLTSRALIAIISIWVRIIAVNMPLQTSVWVDQFDSLERRENCLKAQSSAFEAHFRVRRSLGLLLFLWDIPLITVGGQRLVRFCEQELIKQVRFSNVKRGSAVICYSLCLVFGVSIDGYNENSQRKFALQLQKSINCGLDRAHLITTLYGFTICFCYERVF